MTKDVNYVYHPRMLTKDGGKTEKMPLFRMYTVEQLTHMFDGIYSRRYLQDLHDGDQPVRPKTRRVICRILGRSADELFGEDDA